MSEALPKERGFFFPAEWHPHRATWLSWPHNVNSWPGKIEPIFKPYCEFIKLVARGEKVCINVNDAAMEAFAKAELEKVGADLSQVEFYRHPTNDAWCRDHGPAFVINPSSGEKEIINWGYNAWGDKYPHDLDNQIPVQVAGQLGLKYHTPGIVMEGGSVDFNGQGVLMTTTACLLHENRNPKYSQKQIEEYLINYYGVEDIWWLGDGVAGDDTDGHIDDISRFVSADTVVTVVEPDKSDENHKPLAENLKTLRGLRLPDGKQPNVVELPMPHKVTYEGQRLPASYANFYIANSAVVVPTFRDDKHDQQALDILSGLFTDRPVVGIDSTDIIWGLGSFHCLSQQEPEISRQ